MSAPRRVQRSRTKGWRKPEGTVYVGRGSKWGNPLMVCEMWPTAEQVVSLFRDLVDAGEAWWTTDEGTQWEQRNRWRLSAKEREWLNPETIRAELAGKDLMCWCPLDQPCHADVLLEIANASEGAAAEGATQSCTGAAGCRAAAHVHGCHADLDQGRCNEPAEHADGGLPYPTPHPALAAEVQAAVRANLDQGLDPYAGLHPEIHVPGLLAMPSKRFSDAELAAEYWAPVFLHFPDSSVWDRDYEGTVAAMTGRSATLHRFATTPHHFEHHGPASVAGGDA